MDLTVRPMLETEIEKMVGYFHRLGDEGLRGMGVDPPKLPAANEWVRLLRDDFAKSLDRREFFYTTWLLDGEPIGHCNVNKIEYGRQAYMHLHIWHPDLRRSGIGTECASRSIQIFFEMLRLVEIYCEPYASNEAPSRTLPKAGFRHLATYDTTPGWINFHQSVNRWRLRREETTARLPTRIETDRLLLREFELEDSEVVLGLATQPDVTRYTGDVDVVSQLDDARRIVVETFHRDYRERGYGRLAVIEKTSCRIIGFCGLKFLDDLQEVDIGYRFFPQYWGKGYATEAAQAVVEDGKQRLRIADPIGLVLPDNVQSKRVLVKLGLQHDGDIEEDGLKISVFR